MKHVTLVATLVVASFFILPVPVAQAAPILSTPAGAVLPGDTFVLPIWITDATDVWSWQFDLSFNPAVVQATMVTEGPFLSGSGTTIFSPGVIDNTTGLVSLVTNAYVDLPPNPGGAGVLAMIQFLALAPGSAGFALSNTFVNLLPVATATDSFAVVPEPSTMLAVATGLLLIRARRVIHARQSVR